MTQREQILELKAMRDEKELSVQSICKLIEKSGEHLSKSCVSKIFQDGSESHSFRPDSIKIIKDALSNDQSVMDERIKSIKEQYEKEIENLNGIIGSLRERVSYEKAKAEEKVEKEQKQAEKEREQFNLRIQQLNEHINFLSEQINVKDGRMDQKDKRYDRLFERYDSLFDRFDKKEAEFDKLTDQFLNRCESCKMKK